MRDKRNKTDLKPNILGKNVLVSFLILHTVSCFAIDSLLSFPSQSNLVSFSNKRNTDVPVSTRLRSALLSATVSETESASKKTPSLTTLDEAVLTSMQKIRGGELSVVPKWPRGDKLDKKIIGIAVPTILNFAIAPLVGAIDLFWVGRMGDALAIAGQAAANQVYFSVFVMLNFIPSVMTPLIATATAKGDNDEAQNLVCQCLVVGLSIAAVGNAIILFRPELVLRAVLGVGSPAMKYAKPYLVIRSFSLFFSVISLVAFSAYRGLMDTITPLKVSAIGNAVNAGLDPMFIFKPFSLGVPGAAAATVISEVVSAGIYTKLLLEKKLIKFSKLFQVPAFETLKPLLYGGAAIQLRSVALNIAFLSITRATQSLDNTGVAAAAHAIGIQTFQLGGIFLLAMTPVTAILTSSQLVVKTDPITGETTGGPRSAKMVVDRLMAWGFLLGTVLGGLQLLAIPFLAAFSPLEEVQKAARIPSVIASILQVINGMVFIGEGVMQGCANYFTLAISNVIATIGLLAAMPYFKAKWGLAGVWGTFFVFNGLRLAGIVIHQFFIGPFSRRKMMKEKLN